MPGVEETATRFSRACAAARVRYVVVGGLAVAAWGEPRATQDVDVLLALDATQVPDLVRALTETGLTVAPLHLQDAIEGTGHASVFDDATAFHVDIKVARTPAERDEVATGIEIALPTGTLRVVRPEETIAFKLAYGTPLDIQDARSILVRQGDRLDAARLDRLVDKLGVRPVLDDLRKQIARLEE